MTFRITAPTRLSDGLLRLQVRRDLQVDVGAAPERNDGRVNLEIATRGLVIQGAENSPLGIEPVPVWARLVVVQTS